MQSWKPLSVLLALAIGWSSSTASAQSLRIGDPAPRLEVKSFVKGEPVRAFEPGKIYVVEFWATWCAPCLVSIPHLTELQKKNPEITIIGVSTEADQELVKQFVTKLGDEMNYRVAVNAVPKGKDDGEGATAVSWMDASEEEGIPTAYIVNKEGKIAWVGNPMEMDKPLDMIAKGKWSIRAAAAEQRKEKEANDPVRMLLGKIEDAERAANAKDLLTLSDEVIALRGDAEAKVARRMLATLIKLDQQDKALEFGKKLEKGDVGRDTENLNLIAWTIVDPELKVKPDAKLIQFAVEMARRADEQSKGKNGSIVDTLAKAYFDAGDAAKAVEAQQRAIRLTRQNGETVDQDMKDRLEKYKKAAKP